MCSPRAYPEVAHLHHLDQSWVELGQQGLRRVDIEYFVLSQNDLDCASRVQYHVFNPAAPPFGSLGTGPVHDD